jgi:hypothetical protein
MNSLSEPDRVKAVDLTVQPDGSGQWRIELPPHSVATLVFS